MATRHRSLMLLGIATIICVTGLAPSALGGENDRPAAASAKPLVVCALPAAMPRTGKTADGHAEGLDVAVARLLAKSLGRELEVHWCASPSCSWHCLPEKRCDVVIGQARDSCPAQGVAWSVPYAGGQFGLVVRQDAAGVRSLADLQGKRIGIVTGSVALSEKDHKVIGFRTAPELLGGLAASQLDAAFLDADYVAWQLHEHPELKLRLVEGYVPRERWNMALAVRAESGALLLELNRAIAQLGETGAIREAYARVGVPYRAPFDGEARALGAAAPADTWKRIADRGTLVVCFDPANLPYSSAKGEQPGLDLELARALAERLHVKLEVEWLDVQHETVLGELLERKCDLVPGAAVDANAMNDDESLAGKVLYSQPYYETGYVLVRRKGGPEVKSLAELAGAKAQKLGTEAGSLADYRLRQRGLMRRLYRNQLATLKALDDGDIDFAYLWSNVGWLLHATPEFKLEPVPGYSSEDRWHIAIALRAGDAELKRRVDDALADLSKDGTVQRLLARYHMPRFAALAEPAKPSASTDDGILRHAKADRGREPVMQKVQSSKRGYGALARIRSAGELVVGLDQNNLPFSSAHPEPAGLDVDLARLLAERLGVNLRIYWGYAQHDSYPSKLAAKKLCDVMLGVMPDDRFENRVLFSRPYFVARYELVVRKGAGPPAADAAVAAEEGIAVSGLAGRKVERLASLEAVLGAVASGKAQAGYVISTLGPWLADQRFRDQLEFIQPAGDLDAFPICAAVRKADAELKAAIDKVFDELERSGQLARLFERWHIPYGSAASAGHTKRGPHVD